MTKLIPRDARLARDNLNAFIEKYRPLGAWGMGKHNFEDDAWRYDGVRGKGLRGYCYLSRVCYTAKKHQTKRGQPATIPEGMRMPPLFRDFAKSMLSHLHFTQPSTAVLDRALVLSWMLMELEKTNSVPDPTELGTANLEDICQFIRESGRKRCAGYAAALALIWKVMVQFEMVQAAAHWISPIREKATLLIELGSEFDDARREKLPDPMALEACASLFKRDDTDLRTEFISSYVALAVCAPERIVEFLYAPADLLDPWVDPDTGEEGVTLRWFPAKGGAPQTKNLDIDMSCVARRSHKRMYRISAPARALARWYEDNPTRIYLQPHLEYLRDRGTIDIFETTAILYGGEVRTLNNTDGRALAHKFLKQHNVPTRPGSSGGGKKDHVRQVTMAFADLEQAVLSLLPEGFPVMDQKTGMKYSEALCIVRYHELTSFKCGFMPSILQVITYSMISQALSHLDSKKTKSVFVKNGFIDAEGRPLSMTSHQLRHYLNTIVRRGGTLTEREIAIWSGRKDVNQNRTYDHQSVDDKLHELEVRLNFHSDIQPFGDISKRIFIRRDKFGEIDKITAHLSDIGYCLHDYMQAPCPIAKNCIQCAESLCFKGDKRSRTSLEQLYADSRPLTKAAQRDMEVGMAGANDWFKAHLEREGVLKNLLELFDNPEVPDGTPIMLNVQTPNRIKEAMARRTIPIKSVAAKIKWLADVANLLPAPANNGKDLRDVA